VVHLIQYGTVAERRTSRLRFPFLERAANRDCERSGDEAEIGPRAPLGRGRSENCRDEIHALAERCNEATDGSLLMQRSTS
jgi:hypothetical protein